VSRQRSASIALAHNISQLKLRLKTLADRKKSLQARGLSASKLSTVFVTLDEGFRLFNSDLDKLQVRRAKRSSREILTIVAIHRD
jgi:hypothetical protein